MKKILLVISLLTLSLLNAQKQSIGTTVINRGAKGDPISVKTINGESIEGTGNIVVTGDLSDNIFIPTLPTDFTSPNVANANKIWSIQSDIDTGASDIDLSAVTGVVFHFQGGSLTGTGTITGNITDVRGDVIDASYFSDGYTFAGTWKVTDISAQWFGMVDTNVSALYDNRNALKNALYVANSSGHCNLNVYYGEYYVSANDIGMAGGIDDNNNMGVFNTTHVNVKGHNFPILHALDNNVNPGYSLRSSIFQLFEAKYCSISGFELIGDRQTTTYTPEHKMGVIISNNSDFSEVYGNNIHDFTGDGVYFQTQQYGGYSQIPTQSDSEWTVGNISGVDGTLNAADTVYMSSNAFLDITTTLFQDRGFLYVTGRMAVENYFISYYDATFTFIGKTEELEAYDRIYFPSEARYIKLTMWYEATLDTARPITVNTYDYPRYVKIRDNDIHHCSRQGLSNAPAYTSIINNKFSYIFGQTAGPCAGIDLEDGSYFTAYVNIIGNTFLNNSGTHLLLKYNRHCVVKDNWFGSTDNIENLGYTYYGNFSGGFAAEHSPGTITSNNTFLGRSAVIGRDQNFNNNFLKNTTISIEKGSTNVHDNFCTDVRIVSVDDIYSYVGRPQFYNNNFIYTKAWNWDVDASYVWATYGRYDERSNVFDFKDSCEGIARSIVTPPTVATANSGTGYIDGMIVKGYTGTTSYGFGGYKLIDMSNSYFSCGWKERDDNTTPRDINHQNIHFKNYIELDTRSYNDTNLPTAADYKTIIIDGGSVIKDDATINAELLDVQNWNFNLVIKNFTFETKVSMLGAYMDIDNKGYVIFENCTFKSSDAEVYDFAGSSTSKAYVRNCYFDNVTFTPRVGDVFEYNTTM